MQFSKKAKDNIESCRFCWMCHHVCPIGNATGLERNTARARAMSLSMADRNAIEYSEDVINNVYECALCGGCMTDCATGFDPVMFTKEARLLAALEGKLPGYVMKMLENYNERGSIYGVETGKNIPAFEDSDTLFFVGADVRAFGCAKNAVELLKKAGVDFTVLKDEPNSGYAFEFLLGASAETKEIMENCAKVISKYKKVICYDPADAKVMKREYKEWGIDTDCEIVTFTQFVAELIKEGKLKVKNSGLEFTPQDSPLLARDLEEYKPIREILSACGKVSEMLLNSEHTQLAGNLIMNEYIPEVMEAVAEKRWFNAKSVNAKILVTECFAEYTMLSKTKPCDIELMTVEEAVLKCL